MEILSIEEEEEVEVEEEEDGSMKDHLKDQMEDLEEDSPIEMEEKMEKTHIWYLQKEISKVNRKKSGVYPLEMVEGRKIF